MAKVLIPVVGFSALGLVLGFLGLLTDPHVLVPYAVLGLVCSVGSYIVGQCYRMPLNPAGKVVVIAGELENRFFALRAISSLESIFCKEIYAFQNYNDFLKY